MGELPIYSEEFPEGRQRLSASALFGFWLAVAAAVTAAAAGFGHRIGLWGFPFGFELLRWAVYGAFVAVVACFGSVFLIARSRTMRRGYPWSIAGLAIAAVAIIIPLSSVLLATSAPPIHDITTDPEDPPQFHAILPLRAGAPSSPKYGGPAVALLQEEVYPKVEPLLLKEPPAQAFHDALETAHELGWNIVATAPGPGRIEATDTTFWFGFVDDIVIRVQAQDNGSRVDVRSVSRVGRSDLGTNAYRITKFLAALKARTG